MAFNKEMLYHHYFLTLLYCTPSLSSEISKGLELNGTYNFLVCVDINLFYEKYYYKEKQKTMLDAANGFGVEANATRYQTAWINH